jgi:hypothetical protein
MEDRYKNKCFETDELGFNTLPFTKLNIRGKEVEVRKTDDCPPGENYFCAYVKLKNAGLLRREFLGVSFQEGDWVGIAWSHPGILKTCDSSDQLAGILSLIESVIKRWEEVIGD